MWLGYDESYLLSLFVWLVFLLVLPWLALKLRRRARSRNRSGRMGNLLLSMWLLAVPVTALELYFAFVFDTTDSFNMTRVSQKWFRRHVEPQQHPLTFADGQGIVFRDSRPYTRPEPGQTHLCFLGDSFTFGHGVSNVDLRFSNRVRKAFANRCSDEVVVTNFADAGTDLHWVEAVVQKLIENEHHVDVVVYTMCLNDIETFHPDHAKFYTELGAHGPQFFLFRESYLFNLLYFRARQFTLPEVRNYYQFVQDYYAGEPWDRMSRKLSELDEVCREHQISLRVMVFPFLHNLGEDYAFGEAHEQMTRFCESQGIPVLDLLPILTRHRDESLVVSRFDAHPNERAHELAAEALLSGLLSDLCSDANSEAGRTD